MLIIDALSDWIKSGMVDAVESQYQGIFDSVNSQVTDVSSQVGQTPQGWNGNVFSMIKTLSESVVVPIAGMILTFVLVYELIQMILEKNNMAIYAVLVQTIPSSDDIHGAIWGTAGYTVLLAFALFKTGSLSKSIFSAH